MLSWITISNLISFLILFVCFSLFFTVSGPLLFLTTLNSSGDKVRNIFYHTFSDIRNNIHVPVNLHNSAPSQDPNVESNKPLCFITHVSFSSNSNDLRA